MNFYKIEHYILGKTIGKGGFAKVKEAEHEFTGDKVAVKILSKSKLHEMKAGSRIKREINMLRYFNHPNIIKMYEVLETQTDIFIITEFASKGEISRLISSQHQLSERDAKFLFRQLVAAVEYCHSNLIAHRDLKPENILLDEYGTLKLGDFGLANLMKDGKSMKTDCGSPNYVAPEVIARKKYCGSEVDIWSCGVTLYALLAGCLPFDEPVLPVLFKKIRSGTFHMPNHFSREAKDLIRRMLDCNPLERIKLHEIKQHEWVRYTDVIYLDPREIRHYYGEYLKIKGDVLERVKNMGFNIGGLSNEKLKEAIDKRKEYSFVIGYNLMFDESVKKDVTSKLMKIKQGTTIEKLDLPGDTIDSKETTYQTIDTSKSEKEQILQHLKSQAASDDYSGIFDSAVQKKSVGSLKKLSKDEQENHLAYEQWHYGLKYSLRPDLIMKGITETLVELNTMYFVKSGPYKVKCFYHVHKDFGAFAMKGKDQQMRGGAMHMGMPPAPNRLEKFCKEEIAFKIQIYGLPNKRDHVVDIERIKGHSIVFLDYCQKFIQLLEKKLYADPKSN